MTSSAGVDFVCPPVDEVACSLQFETALPLALTDFSQIVDQFIDEYPTVEEHPPLPPIPLGRAAQFTFQVGSAYQLPRLYLIDPTSTRLVQIQRDRLGVNWRRAGTETPYPRYDEGVRPSLVDAWSRLKVGLTALAIEPPEVAAIEVTYVNPIVVDGDVAIERIIRPWTADFGEEHPATPRGFNLQLTYDLESTDGVLTVDIGSATRNSDGQSVVLMNLIVRASVHGSFENALDCVDKGRGAIVNAFAALTTEEMHQMWQREFTQ